MSSPPPPPPPPGGDSDDENKKSDGDNGDAPMRAKGINIVSGGKVHAFRREAEETPEKETAPTGRTLHAGSSASAALTPEQMREQRLARMAGSSVPKAAPVPQPATPQPQPPPSLKPAVVMGPPATPPAAAPTPSVKRTPQSADRILASVKGEATSAYIIRYVLHAQESEADFEEDNIPTLVTSLFAYAVDEIYSTIKSDLWSALAKLDDTESILADADVEKLLSLHPEAERVSYAVSAYGRLREVRRDMLLKQNFSLTCDAIANGLRVHLMSSFIPVCLDNDPTLRQQYIGELLKHPEITSVNEMLHDISAHSNDISGEVLESIANYLIREGQEAVQREGLPLLTRYSGYLARLLSASPQGMTLLKEMIEKETAQITSNRALVMSSWVSRFMLAPDPTEIVTLLRGVHNYPRVHPNEVDGVLHRPRDIIKSIVAELSGLVKDALLIKGGRAGQDVALRWLNSITKSAIGRADMSKATMRRIRSTEMPDNLAINFTMISLILAKPVCQKLGEKVSLEYVTSQFASENHSTWKQAVKLDRDWKGNYNSGAYNFATQIFFTACDAIHCLVMPCIKVARWSHEAYMRALSAAMQGGDSHNPKLEELALQWDNLRLHLLRPELVDCCNLAAVTLCNIIYRSIQKHGDDGLPDEVAGLPVYLLEDALDWAVFVCHYAPDLVNDAEGMPQLLRFAITLSTHPTLLRKQPMIEARIVDLIAALRENKHSSVWASYVVDGHRSATSLFNIVEQSELCSELPRVLFKVYASSGTEGFDIDKDDHLAHARDHVLPLFVQLISVQNFRDGLIKVLNMPTEQEDAFSHFCHKLSTEAAHCLDDALNRLIEVNDIEILLKTPEAKTWDKQTKAYKEQHSQSQGRSGKGFMNSALRCLQVVQMLLNPNRLDSPPPPPPAIASPVVLRSLAHLVRNFLFQLYGKRGQTLMSLQNPRKYDYDRLGIIQTMCKIISLLATDEAFCKIYAQHDDYDSEILDLTVEEISRTQVGGLQLVQRLKTFVTTTAEVAPETENVGDFDESEYDLPPNKKVVFNENKFTELFEDYQQDSTDYRENGFMSHCYKKDILESEGQTSKELTKAWKREMKLMEDLPLHPQASIFTVSDEARMGVTRALITGPQDTPYAFGMFIFDIFCPPSYPHAPPLVTLKTTGEGTVRFNPNLYESGKVCLSLLGTWFSDGDETKWTPGQSSISQVVKSIQGMILVPDPYFNEPGNEGSKNTTEGDKWSADYNEGLRLGTLRHGILGNLRSPPQGCEKIIEDYYRQLAPVVISTAARWTEEASSARKGKFQKLLGELVALLGDVTETEICRLEDCDPSPGSKRRAQELKPSPAPQTVPQSLPSGLGSSLLAAMASANSSNNNTNANNTNTNNNNNTTMSEDEELARALAASLQDM